MLCAGVVETPSPESHQQIDRRPERRARRHSLKAHTAADPERPWCPAYAVAVDSDASGDVFTSDAL
ncbi:hypothetical protein AJ78_05132 [Emergomyces pasteurianus Ep9510]|uniref:Uncharacterized protein n=1 Tax=Emergomyces pasteurianus Ep9510 TaxID=1447872 RepID=A0A1J9PES5_9EURO|nr:hypothetical protein AJ78_05132 [Emergomyces pasteurianus Ep9510]